MPVSTLPFFPLCFFLVGGGTQPLSLLATGSLTWLAIVLVVTSSHTMQVPLPALWSSRLLMDVQGE